MMQLSLAEEALASITGVSASSLPIYSDKRFGKSMDGVQSYTPKLKLCDLIRMLLAPPTNTET